MHAGSIPARASRLSIAVALSCNRSLLKASRDCHEPFAMKLFGKDTDHETIVIAEIGVNHEGCADVAADLIARLGPSGVDAVKLQSYTPERFVAASDPERLARVRRFALDAADHERLAAAARAAGLGFCSTPISEDWVPLIARLGDGIKIASGDLDFRPVISAAAASGKPVILSTGAGEVAEIDRAIDWISRIIPAAELPRRLALLHCVSEYPARFEDCNLHSIGYLAARYGLAVGWSNHVVGPDACLAAISHGATVIELHVTDNKHGREFRDHALSFEPEELPDLIAKMRRLRQAAGVPGKAPTANERELRAHMRKGLTTAGDLQKGTVLRAEDIVFARPATEFLSGDLDAVVGRRLVADVARGHPIRRADLAS